jgi:hypothetical protein
MKLTGIITVRNAPGRGYSSSQITRARSVCILFVSVLTAMLGVEANNHASEMLAEHIDATY